MTLPPTAANQRIEHAVRERGPLLAAGGREEGRGHLGEALQISALWGRVGRTGRARVLHSPATSA
jgi:hypothetical protein